MMEHFNKYDFNKPLKPLYEQIKNNTAGLNKVMFKLIKIIIILILQNLIKLH